MTKTTKRERLAEDFLAWADEFSVQLYPWQIDAFGQATQRKDGHFVHRIAGISVARGNGKSFAAAAVGCWRLVTAPPPTLILSTALDFEGAKVVLNCAKTILRRDPRLEAAVEILSDELRVPSTGSRMIVRSRDHQSSRGLHPAICIYDECGWSKDDELFASLLASQASCIDPLMLIVSTVGAKQTGPLWRVKTLAEGVAEEISA